MSTSFKVPNLKTFPKSFKLQEIVIFSWLLNRAEGKDLIVLCSIREVCRETRTSINRVYKALERLENERFISLDTLDRQKGLPDSARTLIRVLKNPLRSREKTI